MVELTQDQRSLLEALAKAQTAVPKGGHKEFLTATSFDGVAVILADGVTNLPLDTTDLDRLVELGFVKITRHRAHGDVNGIVTSTGFTVLASELAQSVSSGPSDAPDGSVNTKKSVNIFYSWQSDISPGAACRTLIEDALTAAAKKVSADDSFGIEPVIDRDTQNVPGSPDIGSTILAKIETASAFVADVTIVGRTDSGKPTPNPNVLIELGYALHALGSDRVILVQNVALGGPESLPFDLRQKRVLIFDSPPGATERATERRALAAKLEVALRELIKVRPLRHRSIELSLFSTAGAKEGGFLHCELIAGITNKGTKRFDDWEVEIEFPTALMEPNVTVAIKVQNRSDPVRSLFRTGHVHHQAPLRVGETRSVRLGYRVDEKAIEENHDLLRELAKIRAFINGELVATMERTVAEVLPSEIKTTK